MNYPFSFICLIVCLHCFHLGNFQNLQDVFGIGRSVAGILSSGLTNLLETGLKTSSKNEKIQVRLNPSENISTDDLFSGLSEVWNTKEKKIPNKQTNLQEKDPDSNIMKAEKQDKMNMTTNENMQINRISENMAEKDVESDVESNHWARIRAIVENMKSIFLQTYGENSKGKLEILDMLDKLMEIGDKINMLQDIKDTFDNELLQFLKAKWVDMKDNIVSSSPILNAMLSIDGKILLLAISKGLVRQFGQTFHKQALAHIKEQDFVIETMRQSGFKNSEIYEVFELLDLPTDLIVSSSKTLQTEEERDFTSGRSGGYGGGHKGGHGGGYGSMMKKDPLLLLSALAFATFAAYIIYRFLSSTPAAARMLGSSDNLLPMALSDMPEFVTKVYTWLENADALYNTPEKENNSFERESLVNSINSLWRSFEVDRLSRDCVRRFLCHHLKTNTSKILRYGTNSEQLVLLSLAEMMGEEGAGKLVDSYIEKLIHGQVVDCKQSSPSCDDEEFDSIVKEMDGKPLNR